MVYGSVSTTRPQRSKQHLLLASERLKTPHERATFSLRATQLFCTLGARSYHLLKFLNAMQQVSAQLISSGGFEWNRVG